MPFDIFHFLCTSKVVNIRVCYTNIWNAFEMQQEVLEFSSKFRNLQKCSFRKHSGSFKWEGVQHNVISTISFLYHDPHDYYQSIKPHCTQLRFAPSIFYWFKVDYAFFRSLGQNIATQRSQELLYSYLRNISKPTPVI